MQKYRKPYLSFHPQTERVERKHQTLMKNVLLRNVHKPKEKRSLSVNHSQRFSYRYDNNLKHHAPSRKATGEEVQTRESSIQKGSVTHLQQREKQQRRSCECSECGSRTIFQRDSTRNGFYVYNQIKEAEAQVLRFQRTNKKQYEKLFPQLVTEEEHDNVKNDFMINSFEHIEDYQIQSPQTSRKSKFSFFQSYINKQQQIVSDQRTKFHNHKKVFDKINIRSIPFLHCDLPKVQTPRTPKNSILAQQSPRKNKPNVQMYLQPIKTCQKQHNRLLTLPEFRNII